MKLKILITSAVLAFVSLVSQGQTYNVITNSQGLITAPSTLNETLDLNYQTETGIYANLTIVDNFDQNGSISFGNTPVRSNAYLLSGTLESQTVTYNSQGYPSTLISYFTVKDTEGVKHNVTINWTFTYGLIRSRYVTRLSRSVSGTVEIQ